MLAAYCSVDARCGLRRRDAFARPVRGLGLLGHPSRGLTAR
jgi:hypothetical protein